MTVNLGKEHGELFQQVSQMEELATAAWREAGLDKQLIELVKLRVSQLNGCAYCLRSHTKIALEAGESVERLGILSAWRESQLFSPQEVAALTLAENVNACDAGDYNYAPLNAKQISAISWVVITMNSWNRIALHSRYPVA